MPEDLHSLEELLDRFCTAHAERDQVRLGAIIEEIGSRSFGPLLLFAGLILASPLSGIPGMPTSMGVLVLLISVQLLLRKKHFWLPQWILNRAVAQRKLARAVDKLRRPARFIDRLLRPRLGLFAGCRSEYVIAAVCTLIALTVPLMEVVPFSATTAGVAISIFGLSLISRDGFLALLGFAITGGVLTLVLYYLLG